MKRRVPPFYENFAGFLWALPGKLANDINVIMTLDSTANDLPGNGFDIHSCEPDEAI